MKNNQTKKDGTPEPIILWCNEHAINEMSNKLNDLHPFASNLLAEYKKLPYAKPGADLHYIATASHVDARSYLSSLIPDDFKLNGIRINKEAAINNRLFDLPCYPEFDTALFNYTNSGLPSLEKFFTIEDDEVVIDSETWKMFNDQHSIIAKTPDQIAMHNTWQELITAIKTLDVFMRSHCDYPVVGAGVNIPLQTFAIQTETGLSINYKAFEMLMKKMNKFNS